jgi:hypothetical protein
LSRLITINFYQNAFNFCGRFSELSEEIHSNDHLDFGADKLSHTIDFQMLEILNLGRMENTYQSPSTASSKRQEKINDNYNLYILWLHLLLLVGLPIGWLGYMWNVVSYIKGGSQVKGILKTKSWDK